jgi:ADP-heptose:LPS heptosyltransferase
VSSDTAEFGAFGLPARDRLPDVSKVAVLRANGLGDFLLALPALDALRAAYPAAEIVLLGLRWHCELLAGRPNPTDRVVRVPAVPGLTAESGGDHHLAPAPDAFFRSMRAERFDLALQMHGGGGTSNGAVRRLGARVTAGARAEDAEPLDRWIPYHLYRHETLRLLEVAALVGARPVTLQARLPVLAEDLAEAQPAVPSDGSPLVALHAGSTDPRRRWPPRKFAQLADELQRAGCRVVLTGTAPETEVTRQIVGAAERPPIDTTGSLSVRGLAGLLARCRLVVSNDTGAVHLARAVGAPTVVVLWVGNAITAGPVSQECHRAVLAWSLDCPVCGVRNVEVRCPHDASFVAEVRVEDVLAACEELLSAAPADADREVG